MCDIIIKDMDMNETPKMNSLYHIMLQVYGVNIMNDIINTVNMFENVNEI